MSGKLKCLSQNAINYAIKRLMDIADPGYEIQYQIKYIPSESVELQFGGYPKKIIIELVSFHQWEQVRSKKAQIFWCGRDKFCNNIHIGDKFITDDIPAIFYRNQPKWMVEVVSEDLIKINVDIISTTLFMLTRWEETFDVPKDQHGRFMARECVAYQNNFLHRPIVDEYAMLLRECLEFLLPRWQSERNSFKVLLSHDIDQTRRFPNFWISAKTIMGDLIKRNSPSLAWRSFRGYLLKSLNGKPDPYIQGIIELINLSLKNRLYSEFYFKTAKFGKYDSGDPIDDEIMKVVEMIRKNGFSIGFHPGYYTYNNEELFLEEKRKFEEIFKIDRYGGRQHYLRFKVPRTWYIWANAGLSYDSSLGYPDHEGFRCGTCHPYKPFDFERDQEINIVEIPLIAMDGTLKKYRRFSIEEAHRRIIGLANTCKQYEGIFTLLWHNRSTSRDWSVWFEMYKRVLSDLEKI
jgi:hypothetical protein